MWPQASRTMVHPRCWVLATRRTVAAPQGSDVVFFVGGGYASGCTVFSAQPLSTGDDTGYWVTGQQAAAKCYGPLLELYGYEGINAHTGEFAATIMAFQKRQPGAWNLFVGDRLAWFAPLDRAKVPVHRQLGGPRWAPDGRLAAQLRELEVHWAGQERVANKPLWRLSRKVVRGRRCLRR